MIENPLISIVIPVYNGEKYLGEAIDSALAQTYQNYEIVVVNDGSTDKTNEVVEKYSEKIRFYTKLNGGQSSALNYGISKMKGEYFCWLSHDDLYSPDKLQQQVDALAKVNRASVVVYSDYAAINAQGDIIKESVQGDVGSIHPSYYLLAMGAINGNTVLIPKALLEECGGFNEKRPHSSDVELFFKLSRVCEFIYVNKVLAYSRVHPEQATWKRYSYHIYESNLYMIDSLNSLTVKDLLAISNYENIAVVLRSLAIKWSSVGYKAAYMMALYRLFNEVKGTWLSQFSLSLRCRSLYIRKVARRRLRAIVSSYGRR